MPSSKRAFWVEFQPIDPATGNPVRVRICTENSSLATGVDLVNGEWLPYLTGYPDLNINVFEGQFNGTSTVSVTNLEATDTFKDGKYFSEKFSSYVWDGTPVVIYKGLSTDSTLGQLNKVFTGVSTDAPEVENGVVSWGVRDRSYLLDTEIFNEVYEGSGGVEGRIEVEGIFKPVTVGNPKNTAPVLIDAVNLVWQYNSAGPSTGVSSLWENGLDYGTVTSTVAFNTDDATTYQDLIDVPLEPGQWADCPHLGMFRLGGEPVSSGVLTVDAVGPSSITGSRVDNAIDFILQQSASYSDMVDASTLTGVYTSSGNQTYGNYITSPVTLGDVLAEILGSMGAYYFFSTEGKLRIGFIRVGTPALEIRSDATSEPIAEHINVLSTRAPYKRVRMGADRSFRVHSNNEISDALLDAVQLSESLLGQTPSLLPNSDFSIIDKFDLVAGIEPVEGTNSRFGAFPIDTGLRIFSGTDTTIAYGFPAIPIDDRKVYTLTIRHKSSVASTQGLYLRFNELNSSLDDGTTHIGSVAGGVPVTARTGWTDLIGNGPMPGPSVIEETFTYTPTPGTKFASFSMYNWSAFAGEYDVEWVALSEQGNHEVGATLGATFGDGGNIANSPAEGEYIRGMALATMNNGGIGDLIFAVNTTASGASNDGEIQIKGTTFFPNRSLRHVIDQTKLEIQTPYEGTRRGYPFFIIYSQEDVTTRFPGWGSGSGSNRHFFCAEYDPQNQQWTARDNTYAGYNFDRRGTDCIVAVCEKQSTSGGIEKLNSLVNLSKSLPTLPRNATSEHLFSDDFSQYTDSGDFFDDWESVSGSGEIAFNISATLPGGHHLQIGNNSGNDARWLIHRYIKIPFDPEALYEIEFIVRQWQGAGRIYLGVCGYAEDRVTRVNTSGNNTVSSQHYVAASNFDLPQQTNTKLRGYFKGRAASGNGGQHNSASDPATLHSNVDFFSPMIIANHPDDAGRLDVASCRVRIVSLETIEPATGRVFDPQAYNTQALLGPRNITDLDPTYGTPSGGNVQINLGAHNRRIAGFSGPTTLNFGSVSTSWPVSSYWAAYMTLNDLESVSSPTVSFTSDPDDLLWGNRYQLASGMTPNSSGSGGSGGGGGGSGGIPGCVSVDSWIEVRDYSKRARQCKDGRYWIKADMVCAGDYIRCLDEEYYNETAWRMVTSNSFEMQGGVRITMPDGATLELSDTTPITQPDGSTILSPDIDGCPVAQFKNGKVVWSRCKAELIDRLEVAHISCTDGTYLAGMLPGEALFSHNMADKP